MNVHAHITRLKASLLGTILIGGIGRRIVRVQLDDDMDRLRADVTAQYPEVVIKRGSATTMDAARVIRDYLAGGPDPDLDVVLPETGFSTRVWKQLRRIPRGEVRTYGRVARAIRKTGAARAVGQACGRNPLPLIYPCHRVVAADRSLGGFSAGLEKKRKLLELEGVRVRG